MLNPITSARGVFSAAQLREKIHADVASAPRQRLVEVEQTSNFGGGTIWPLAALRETADIAHAAGLVTHLDGARLFNACIASGVAAAEYAERFDSVWIDFSKGLGAPGGAVLAGPRDFIHEATRLKLRWGGAMRQSGIIAAACEHALDHHVARLAEDHANAQRLAAGIATLEGLRIDRASVETNLVYFDVVATGWDPATLCAALLSRGVRMSPMGGPRSIRAVTHLDVSDADIETTLGILRETLQRA